MTDLRTALAQPEPADGDVSELLKAARASFMLTQDPADYPADHWSRRAAALLAQRHPAPVPEDEAAKLVDKCIVTYAEDPAIISSGSYMLIDDGKARGALLTRIADLLAQRHQPLQPVAVSERLQQMEDLAADAVSALRYIEAQHGRLYGVGWDRVYEKADRLQPSHGLPIPTTPPEAP